MADEQTTDGQQTTPPQTADGGQQTPPVQNGDGKQPGPVPYDRFTEIVGQKNDITKQRDDLQAWKNDREAADKKAKEDRLAEEGKLQELLDEREKELEAERTTNTRQRVAMQKGIPAELVDRLTGDTEEKIAADADKLLAFIKPQTGPGVPPLSRGGTPTTLDISKMSMEEVRKHSAELSKQALG